jgi:uncharacterized protein YjbI with pentapeptide repeats
MMNSSQRFLRDAKFRDAKLRDTMFRDVKFRDAKFRDATSWHLVTETENLKFPKLAAYSD